MIAKSDRNVDLVLKIKIEKAPTNRVITPNILPSILVFKIK